MGCGCLDRFIIREATERNKQLVGDWFHKLINEGELDLVEGIGRFKVMS